MAAKQNLSEARVDSKPAPSRPAHFLIEAFGTISDRLRLITSLFALFNFAFVCISAITGGLRSVVVWLSALTVFLSTILFIALRTSRDAMRQLAHELDQANANGRDLTRRIEELQAQVQASDPMKLYDAACRVIGFARDDIVKDARLFDDGHIESKWSASLKAVSQSVELVEHRYRSDAPTNDIPTKEFTHDNRIVTIEPMGVVGGDTIYGIRIAPSIAPGSEYSLPPFSVTSGRSAFVMRQPHPMPPIPHREYSRTRMSYPSNRLRILMHFPRLFVPRAYGYDVWYGEGKIRHNEEYGRVSRGFSMERDATGSFYLLFEVDHPILGMFYALWWEPPVGEATTHDVVGRSEEP